MSRGNVTAVVPRYQAIFVHKGFVPTAKTLDGRTRPHFAYIHANAALVKRTERCMMGLVVEV